MGWDMHTYGPRGGELTAWPKGKIKWRMANSPTRKRDRSKTNQGIANAMADQWGAL